VNYRVDLDCGPDRQSHGQVYGVCPLPNFGRARARSYPSDGARGSGRRLHGAAAGSLLVRRRSQRRMWPA
jgi:hypothetical protein